MKNHRLLRTVGLSSVLALLLFGGAIAEKAGPDETPGRTLFPPQADLLLRPGLAANAVQGQEWVIEWVDAPKMFSWMGSRSLVLDTTGQPHIAYGQDHLYYAWYDGLVWHLETVDTSAGVGLYTSIALDTTGRPHISYYDVVDKNLKYARYDGSTWQIEVVDEAGDVGKYTSLALDNAGQPHISYCSCYPLEPGVCSAIKYAHRIGANWSIEVVYNNASTGASTALAIDSLGRPHIGYIANDGVEHAWYDGANWQTEVADPLLSYWAANVTLALDANDHAHMAYYDGYSRYHLKYAHYDGASWQTEIVESVGSMESFPSLALDSAGRPHIAYRDGLAQLKYAWYDGSAWQSNPLGGFAIFISLALAADGRPHISYSGTRYGLEHTYYDGNAWQTEEVDQSGTAGTYTSLALDQAGWPHVSYEGLKYAYRNSAGWQIETIENAGETNSSLALDSADHPHISYLKYEGGGHDLKYAYTDGTGWQTETVAIAAMSAHATSLALDTEMYAHISYFDGYDWIVKYAHNDGSAWHIQPVGEGYNSSLALDDSDRPRISAGALYASYDGSIWHLETVDESVGIVRYTSLALDSLDRPHISYQDGDRGELRYAYSDGSAWYTETVDSGGVGRYNSLALDAAGRPHIAYYDATNGDLRYAWHNGVSWYTRTVDSIGDIGQYISLALDVAGQPHITYYDATNGDLKYAYLCTLPASVRIAGPLVLIAGRPGTYQGIAEPITASRPITFTWDNGTVGPTAAYGWPATGTYTLTVTGTNACGQGQGMLTVQVIEDWPYRFYLPVMLRAAGSASGGKT